MAGDTPVLVHNCSNAAVHDPENIVAHADDNLYFHYTSPDGHAGILNEDGSLTITSGTSGKVHLTQEMYSPSEAENSLYIGNPGFVGKADSLFAFRLPEGIELEDIGQPNELIHRGTLRIPSDYVVYHGANPFS